MVLDRLARIVRFWLGDLLFGVASRHRSQQEIPRRCDDLLREVDDLRWWLEMRDGRDAFDPGLDPVFSRSGLDEELNWR